jgi:uncharacterized membrane protein
METIVNAFTLLAATALGLTAGALLAEGAILVPFWRSLAPESFLVWYRQNAALLLKFFGPLEVVAGLVAVAAGALSWFHQMGGRHLLAISALLAVTVLAVFPLYFQRVNASFAAGTIAPDRVAAELRRWSTWHWVRTILATAAFISAVAAG